MKILMRGAMIALFLVVALVTPVHAANAVPTGCSDRDIAQGNAEARSLNARIAARRAERVRDAGEHEHGREEAVVDDLDVPLGARRVRHAVHADADRDRRRRQARVDEPRESNHQEWPQRGPGYTAVSG